MNKKTVVSVLVIVLVAVGVWYVASFKKSNQTSQQTSSDFQKNSISSAYIYGLELNKVKVYLYAPDEKITTVTDDYCGGTKGSEVRSGNYKLILDSTTATSDNPGGGFDQNWHNSSLDLGPMEFVKGKSWDGKLIVDEFDSFLGYKNFIVIQQYGSCNGSQIKIFGYDFSREKLVEYKFSQGNAHNDIIDNLFVSNFKKSTSGNLITSTYDQNSGKTVNTEWTFNSQNDRFEPKQISDGQQTLAWKDDVYNQFKNLTAWKITENVPDWNFTDLSTTERANLHSFENNFNGGKIFRMDKTFNSAGFSGANIDQQLNQAGSDQKALEDATKKALVDNGWKFNGGPNEGGFYHDYFYTKNGHPLLLQTGTRNAIIGGMYVDIEFQY